MAALGHRGGSLPAGEPLYELVSAPFGSKSTRWRDSSSGPALDTAKLSRFCQIKGGTRRTNRQLLLLAGRMAAISGPLSGATDPRTLRGKIKTSLPRITPPPSDGKNGTENLFSLCFDWMRANVPQNGHKKVTTTQRNQADSVECFKHTIVLTQTAGNKCGKHGSLT